MPKKYSQKRVFRPIHALRPRTQFSIVARGRYFIVYCNTIGVCVCGGGGRSIIIAQATQICSKLGITIKQGACNNIGALSQGLKVLHDCRVHTETAGVYMYKLVSKLSRKSAGAEAVYAASATTTPPPPSLHSSYRGTCLSIGEVGLTLIIHRKALHGNHARQLPRN